MPRYLLAGHVSYDLFPQFDVWPSLNPGELVEAGRLGHGPGGCVANTGSTLAGLGEDVELAACVGRDFLADLLREELRRRGLAVEGLRESDLGTSYTIVTQAPGTDRAFWHSVGANAAFDGADLPLAGVDVVHTGYPALLPRLLHDAGAPMRRMLESARAAGAATSVDLVVVDPRSPAGAVDWPGFMRTVLPAVDVITPSIDDLRSILGGRGAVTPDALLGAADALVAGGARCAAVTAGTAGFAVVTTPRPGPALPAVLQALPSSFWGTRAWFPAPVVATPVSTTGAGDAFTAGFLAGLGAGHDVEDVAASATRSAVAHVSGSRGSPSRRSSRADQH